MSDFEKICDFANLMEAAHACGNGVRWKASVQAFDITRLRQCARLKKQLENGTYRSKGFHEFTINERGKARRIQSVHISERCVQKSLCNNVMKPTIVPKLVYDNAASLKGKGTEFALNRLKCHLERHYRKHGLKGGILTMDFKNYLETSTIRFFSTSFTQLLPTRKSIAFSNNLLQPLTQASASEARYPKSRQYTFRMI